MARGQYRLFILLLAAGVLVLLNNGVSAEGYGEWTPIRNISEPHVQGLGEYAVKVHNERKGTNLKFHRVISGYTQLVNGINYKLYIEAVNGEFLRPITYEAIVWENRSLSNFTVLLQG